MRGPLRSSRSRVAGWLLWVALMQACMPVLAAPSMIVEQGGRVVVLCTAQGLQQVRLSPVDGQPVPQQQLAASCPVCLLGHAVALPPAAPALPPVSGLFLLPVVQPFSAPPGPALASIHIRGPPSV